MIPRAAELPTELNPLFGASSEPRYDKLRRALISDVPATNTRTLVLASDIGFKELHAASRGSSIGVRPARGGQQGRWFD